MLSLILFWCAHVSLKIVYPTYKSVLLFTNLNLRVWLIMWDKPISIWKLMYILIYLNFFLFFNREKVQQIWTLSLFLIFTEHALHRKCYETKFFKQFLVLDVNHASLEVQQHDSELCIKIPQTSHSWYQPIVFLSSQPSNIPWNIKHSFWRIKNRISEPLNMIWKTTNKK